MLTISAVHDTSEGTLCFILPQGRTHTHTPGLGMTAGEVGGSTESSLLAPSAPRRLQLGG